MAVTEPVMAQPVSAASFVAELRGAGYDFFAGVPCSLIKGLIAALTDDPDVEYYPEPREDAAIGLAAGARMAGRQPAVLMQNSGLGVCLNALTSMSLMYRLPCLLLITWRGYEGQDAPEHLIMGDVCRRLLETIGIPYRAPTSDSLADDIAWAAQTMKDASQPVALLVRKGLTE